jgi:hypothetical protein
VLDGVFSHTGADSRYFNKFKTYRSKGAYSHYKDSPYYSWYRFKSGRDDYDCWWGIDTLPNINEMDPSFFNFIISGKDSEGSDDLDRDTVVSLVRNGKREDMISSFWGWGELYHRILESVLDGSWYSLNKTSEAGQGINYWWGLSGNAVEVKCEPGLPDSLRRLVMLLREQIAQGALRPFEGPVYDQRGLLRIVHKETATLEQILHMDWLADNVVGSADELRSANLK